MQKFRFFDHEADIGVEIYGESFEELFKNAAHALFSIIVEKRGENSDVTYEKKIELKKDGELLISFLNELIFLWETEGFVLEDLSIELDEEKLKATLFGKKFDEKVHAVKKEVKAVTYHNFEIKKTDSGYTSRLIFDI